MGAELTAESVPQRDEVEALTRTNADVADLLCRADVAAVLAGPDGRIRRFTPTAARLFQLTPADVGRPLTDVPLLLVDGTLYSDVRAVIRDGTPVEREVSAPDGRWYLRRTLPDRAADGRIDGVILTYSDVTRAKQLEREVLEIAAEEQTRLSRELHDTVGQQLTGLRLMAETLADALGRCQSPDAELARRIRDGMRASLARVRSLSYGLLPASAGEEGLGTALANLAAWARESAAIECTLEQSGDVPPLGPECETQLLRIAQEAVTNALKHARARRIAITLRTVGGRVELRVTDDGCGLPDVAPHGRGLGIRSMRYRAGLLGAAFHLESGPLGTQMSCTLRPEKSHDSDPGERV